MMSLPTISVTVSILNPYHPYFTHSFNQFKEIEEHLPNLELGLSSTVLLLILFFNSIWYREEEPGVVHRPAPQPCRQNGPSPLSSLYRLSGSSTQMLKSTPPVSPGSLCWRRANAYMPIASRPSSIHLCHRPHAPTFLFLIPAVATRIRKNRSIQSLTISSHLTVRLPSPSLPSHRSSVP